MSVFLDVDDSIQTRNLLLPNKDRDAFDDQMNELMKQFESKPFLIVQPIPGICIKVKNNDGEKVFLNVCISDKIPPPADISDAELYEILSENLLSNFLSNYAIPMSIGTERIESDKFHRPCATYDIMINSAYFKKCREKKHFMSFTILVIMSGVSNKFGKELDVENYVILKNRTTVGKLVQHRIENREFQKPQCVSKQLIEEISYTSGSNNSKISLQNSNKITETKLDYIILKEKLKDPVERLIVLFNISKSVSIEDIIVLINSERINVTDEKACYSHDVLLPYTINIDEAKAFFDHSIKVLRLDVPVQPKQNKC